MTRTHTLFTVLLIAIVLLPVPTGALASHSEEVTVITNLTVSASSGGNTAASSAGSEGTSADGSGSIESRQVIEGGTSANVFIETTVNGEVVESIDEHYEDLDGVIERNTVQSGDNYSIETHIEVSGGSISGDSTKEKEDKEATTTTNSNPTTYEVVRLGESQKAAPAAAIEVVNEHIERGIMTEEKQQEKAAAKNKSSFFTFFSQIFNYVFSIFTR